MGLIFGYLPILSRRSGVLGHVAGQRLEKLDQIRAVLGRKVERLDLLIQIWIGVAASGVKIDHVLERLQAAVMHVGRGERDIAQGRRLELALGRLLFLSG